MTALTAQAARMAELLAENTQLKRENAVLRSMQALVDAKTAAKHAEKAIAEAP